MGSGLTAQAGSGTWCAGGSRLARGRGAWCGGRRGGEGPGRRRGLPGSGASPSPAPWAQALPPSLPAPGGTLRLCRERPASGRCTRGGGGGEAGRENPQQNLALLRSRSDLNDRSPRPRSAADTREPVPPTTRAQQQVGARADGWAEGPRAMGRARAAHSDFPLCAHRRCPGESLHPALSGGPCAGVRSGTHTAQGRRPLRDQGVGGQRELFLLDARV